MRTWAVAGAAVLLAACGSGDPAGRGGPATPAPPSAPATISPGPPARVAPGQALAWTPDGQAVLVGFDLDEGASAIEQCPEPQPHYDVWSFRADGTDRKGTPLTRGAKLFEPAAGVVSPDGARLAVLHVCDEEFIGAVAVMPLGKDGGGGKVTRLPQPARVSYATPFLPASLGWLSPTELLVLRMSWAGDDELRNEAVAYDVTTGRERVVPTPEDVVAVRPVPGGLVTMAGEGRRIRAEYTPDGGAPHPLGDGVATPAPDGSAAVVWTPDEESGESDEPDETRLRLVGLRAGTAERSVTLRGSLLGVAWSPRADRLVAVTEDYPEGADESVVRSYVVTAAGAVSELPLPEQIPSVPLWSPDGTRLAYDIRPLGSHEVRVVAVP